MNPSSFPSRRPTVGSRAQRTAPFRPLASSLARLSSAAAICAALALASSPRSAAAPAAWDVDGLTNGTLTSGSGTWSDGGAANFTNLADSIPHFAWSNAGNAGDSVVFGGTGGTAPFTVTITGTINAAGIQFATLGYTLTGGTLNLGAAGTIATNVDAAVDSIIAGNGLTSSGAGTLLLRGANTFTGQYTIGIGTTVIAANNAALGATGPGNETVVNSDGTLDVGGSVFGAERIRISGNGAGGIGALTNSGVNLTAANDIQFLTLNGSATVNAQGQYSPNLGSGTGTSYGRLEVRTAAYTAGAQNLFLGGNTLTKIGRGQFSIVNADVTNGFLVINDGIFGIEADTRFDVGATITVNAPARLGFFNLASTAVVPNITVAGASIGEVGNATAAQTLNSNLILTTGPVEFWANTANGPTFGGVISGTVAGGVTEIAKRGAGTIALTNPANSFDAPLRVSQGTLRADFTTTLGAGGVPPAAPLTTTDTPLGTASGVTISGGTLAIRINLADDATNQQFNLQRSITVDLAPGTMTFDRLSNAAQTNKILVVPALTFAPPSAANGYSIGQNQLTFTQGNTHRLQVSNLTMNNDAVVNTGDVTFENVLSAGGHSLVRTGGNTQQFVTPSTHEFNAFFNLGTGSLRVGTGFGTPVTSTTVTVGTGPIYLAPASGMTFRTPTNIAADQTIELVSNRVGQAAVNFELFTSLPAGFRALGSGVIAVGNATGFGDIDLGDIGDGTFRLGSNISSAGNGTITGVISPGAGGLVRVGAAGTLTISGTNRITGASALDVGSALINGGFVNQVNNVAQNGTVALTGANNYTGGTTVNRSSSLDVQAGGALGSGAVEAFGTLQLSGANGTLVSGGGNSNVINFRGGGGLTLNNSALTGVNGQVMSFDRWHNNTGISLTSGNLTFIGHNAPDAATLFTSVETVGPLTITGGNTLNLNRSGTLAVGQNVELTIGNLVRNAGATLEVIRTTGTGAGYGGGHKLFQTSAPTPVNGMVGPWIVAQNNGPGEYLTYGGTGYVPITYDGTYTTGTYTPGTNNVVAGPANGKINVTTAALTLTDNPIWWVLRTDQNINSGAGTSIALRGGGLNSNNSTGTVTIAPAVSFQNSLGATAEGVIYNRSGGTLLLSGAVTANGLAKFGPGTLNLSANNGALSGNVSVNQGILQLFGPTATGTYNVGGTGSVVLNGGQLNLRSNNTAVTGTINPTMQMGLTVAAGIPIATLDVNRSGADTASSGTFNFQYPGPTLLPGLQLLGAPGAQGQTFTVSGANYNVIFGTFALNSSNGNVTYNITGGRTVELARSPTITGTAPIITKSGDGTLIYARAFGTEGAVSPAGTRIVVNAGVLEPRSILSFGSVATATIELNGGQLNLRRDSGAVWSGNTVGSGTGYPVVVNGNSTLTADRLSAGSNFRLGLGALTINGNPTLTLTSGNGVSSEFQSIRLNGLPTFSSSIAPGDVNTAFRSSGAITGGGFIKTGTGHMHILGGGSTYDGGTWVNQGILRVRSSGGLGNGPVFVNPGAIIDFNSFNNLSFGQPMIVRGNSNFLPMISMNTDNAHPTSDVDTSAAPVGIIGLSNTTGGFYSTPIDMGSLYGGGWYLGGISTGAYDARYTADTLGVGAGNTYRLGGGGLAFVASVDFSNTPINNLLTGAEARVVYGFDSGNLRGANTTTFQFVIGGTQDYGGATLINRGTVTRIVSANNGTQSGLSSSTVDVFGNLAIGTDATLATAGGGSTNEVILHPGAALHLDNNNVGGQFVAVNVADRWGDSTPIVLNGALLDLVGNTDALSAETVGDVTYARGARIRVGRNGTTGTATLTLNSLTAAGGTGNTLTLQSSAAGTLGSASDQLIVANSTPAVTNGMTSPSIVNATDNTFVTYGGTGFANATYDKTLNATYTAGSLLATDKVDVGTAALTLTDNPTVHALRTNQNINVGGANSKITIRSGGLIGMANTLTIQPSLVFNNGTTNIEARIYNSSTVNINGSLTAAGITKFGTGNLMINVAQPDYASGWTVNAGTLQINDLGGLGQSVPGNTVTVNATQTTSGSASQALGITNLTFNRNTGSPELGVFSGGPITVVNEGTIRVAAGTDDRNLQIPNVTLLSTGTNINTSGVGFTFDVPNNRFRATIPTLTLESDVTMRVFDSGSTADTGRVTAGVVNSLVGTDVSLNKIGNRTLELAGDNSATFTDGSIVVSQGTVRVLHNGSLGSATSTATIERNATLEIAVANFAPTAAVTQLAGSIERWNVENARPAVYNLPAGVNLQLNTNLLGAHVIGLNGGSLEGFLWIDHPAAADQRVVGSNVNISLLADSFVGQNVLLGQGYDLGRQPTNTGPFGNNITGSYLVINGGISGSFNLTKTGLDTVVLASPLNTYNNTFVDMGVLRIGTNNALPAGGALITRYAGTFDLFGFNQSVAGLGIEDSATSPGAVSVGSSGRIVNSAATDNVLTVNNATDYTYNGTIERTVALVKEGNGTLTIGAANSFTGGTTINDGTLRIFADTGLGDASGDVAINNDAILQAAGDITSNREFALGAGGGTIDTNGNDVTLAAASSVTGTTLTKIGGGTLTLAGTQTYSVLNAEEGRTNLNSTLANAIINDDGGTLNVNANANNSTVNVINGDTHFLVSQTLAALNIGANGIATVGGPAGAPAAFEEPAIDDLGDGIAGAASDGPGTTVQAVPEPGTVGLLLFGLLGLATRRRRSR